MSNSKLRCEADIFYPEWLQVKNNSCTGLVSYINNETTTKSTDSYDLDSKDSNAVGNYRIPALGKGRQFNLKIDNALGLKIEEFCHKHKKCLICDLNVNSQTLQYLVDIQKEISCSGLPNYLGCRIPVVSNLKIEFIRSMLSEYDDQNLCDLLEFGFPLGYSGNLLNVKKPRNHSGARDYPEFIMKYLKKELEYQAIIGPFKSNPFINSTLVLSPLNSVPKSTPGERRVILDLSFPAEGCVNDGISKDVYLGEVVNLKYPSVDDLVNLIKQKGRNCHIFKRDLKRAYRQIPIDPGDVNLVGFHWKNHIFVDRVLSMGLRSSAHICQRVTSAVIYMMKKSGYLLLNYLDDFAGAERPDESIHVFDLLGKMLENCGLEESKDKACAPSTVMTFLGVEFNTSDFTLYVTPDRVQEIEVLVQDWLLKSTATVRELQSLLGKLHFISSCVRPGRLFVSRLLTWLRSLSDDNGLHVIPMYVKKDLLWWCKFLKTFNGVSMMSMEDWSRPDEILESDATLSGCGGWFPESREFFHVEFPSFLLELNLHINQCELLAVMICVKLWRSHFVNKKILLKCDNQTTVSVLNSGSSRDSFLQKCLREILYFAARFNFEVRAVYFPEIKNRTADLLSRWHMDVSFKNKFYDLSVVRSDITYEKFVYVGLFEFTHDW